MWFRNELSSLAEVSLYYQDELMGEIYQAEISKWYDVKAIPQKNELSNTIVRSNSETNAERH